MITRWYLRLSLLGLTLAAPRMAHSQCPEPCLIAVRRLRLDSLAGPVETYYSTGSQARAIQDQALLRKAERFFADSLRLETGIHLALLNEADWKRVSDHPYGLPHVSREDRVAFLPATDDGVITRDFMRLERMLSDTVRAKMTREGVTFAEFALSMTDVIGLHELGHTYVTSYGIKPHTRWFNEFLASYFAFVFLQSTHPQQARLIEAMIEARFEQPPPAHTSLDDFEKFYGRTMPPENINWYQAVFMQQIIEVNRSQGLGFLRAVSHALPLAEPDSVSPQTVLDRLNRIHPGFRAWADRHR
jgi:hypothetical protein